MATVTRRRVVAPPVPVEPAPSPSYDAVEVEFVRQKVIQPPAIPIPQPIEQINGNPITHREVTPSVLPHHHDIDDIIGLEEVLRRGIGMALVAAGPINSFKLVTTDAEGKAIYCDAGNIAHINRVAGITISAALAGADLVAQHDGVVKNDGWSWTAGQPLYVGLAGDITPHQVGAFCQQIGFAKSATEIVIQFGIGIGRA